MDKITVSAAPLRQLLIAVTGAPHYIRELQATRNPAIFPDNPINVLCGEYDAASKIEAQGGVVPDNLARLHYLYNRAMKMLVTCTMSFEEWLLAIDTELAKPGVAK